MASLTFANNSANNNAASNSNLDRETCCNGAIFYLELNKST